MARPIPEIEDQEGADGLWTIPEVHTYIEDKANKIAASRGITDKATIAALIASLKVCYSKYLTLDDIVLIIYGGDCVVRIKDGKTYFTFMTTAELTSYGVSWSGE